jgi:hypothetical protein
LASFALLFPVMISYTSICHTSRVQCCYILYFMYLYLSSFLHLFRKWQPICIATGSLTSLRTTQRTRYLPILKTNTVLPSPLCSLRYFCPNFTQIWNVSTGDIEGFTEGRPVGVALLKVDSRRYRHNNASSVFVSRTGLMKNVTRNFIVKSLAF